MFRKLTLTNALAALAGVACILALPAMVAAQCLGDCDANNSVTASDLAKINQLLLKCPCSGGLLGGDPAGCAGGGTITCAAADKNMNNCITASEKAQINAQVLNNGSTCPAPPTPTPVMNCPQDFTVQLAEASQARIQTLGVGLFPTTGGLALQGTLRVEVSCPDANGIATITMPAADAHLQPVDLGALGTACVELSADAVGTVDCDGGSTPGPDFTFTKDHDTNPAHTIAGSPPGLPNDVECDDVFTFGGLPPSYACQEGKKRCLGGTNFGMLCTTDAGCPGSTCVACSSGTRSNSTCDSPTVITESGTFRPGDVVLTTVQKITVVAPAAYGADGIPCTADDGDPSLPPTESPAIFSTGHVQAEVWDATTAAGGTLSKNNRIGTGSLTSCETNADCPSICLGGSNAGGQCFVAGDCPGGSCPRTRICIGGTNNLQPCLYNSDCPGSGAYCNDVGNLLETCYEGDPPLGGGAQTLCGTGHAQPCYCRAKCSMAGCVNGTTGNPGSCAAVFSASPNLSGLSLGGAFPTLDFTLGGDAVVYFQFVVQ